MSADLQTGVTVTSHIADRRRFECQMIRLTHADIERFVVITLCIISCTKPQLSVTAHDSTLHTAGVF